MKIKTIKEKTLYTVAVGVSIFLLFLVISVSGTRGASLNADKNIKREIIKETVVVSQQSDPYYTLAQKIAQEENLEIAEAFADVLKFNPRFIILVASPENLTQERLSSIGYILKNQDYYPGLGIISGSTLEKAEQLWARRGLAKEGHNYVGGDVEILQLIYEPTIFNISEGKNEKIALNKNNLIETLKQADYFYWTRHTGPRDWSWNEESGNWSENDQLLAKDIPELKPAVIYSLTCSPFRPWVENSIALAFVDNGAAAYLGFVNSPHTSVFLKHGLNVSGLTSWEDFPLGVVAQIHNKAATKTVFSSPQLFMLGDPRIYLSKDQPYRVIADTVAENGPRIITGESDKNGILAVKIDGGAEYEFLSVKGLTSVSEKDIFYNNKLQTLNLGRDKYVLFLHNGGHFEIELLKYASVGWSLTDALTDAFDFSWVVLWLSTYADSNPHIYIISLPVFIGILLFKVFKRKKSIKDYGKIFLVALILVLLRLAYFWLRLDDYTVSANLVSYTSFQITLGCAGVFAGVAGGLMLMKDGKNIRVKSLGLIFAVLRQFWLAGFYLVFTSFLNSFTQVTQMTEPWLLSYDSFWLSFIVLIFEVFIILTVYRYVISNKRQNEKI